jgi:NADH dehydrogenase FAD-containing subunit
MTDKKTIIILGGGTGGLVAVNELNKKIGKNARVILIDKNTMHVYAPSFLYLMLGKRKASKIQKPFSRTLRQKLLQKILFQKSITCSLKKNMMAMLFASWKRDLEKQT